MSVIHGVNYGTPTLDLNFAKNKSLIDTVTGRNLVTFTRASTGTYVGADGLIKTAVANEARFDHNPLTGECLGLLVEESRSNLNTNSGGFVGFAGVGGGNYQADVEISPDGTLTADLFNSSASGLLQKNISYVAGQTYTFSAFVKPNLGSLVRIQIYNLGYTGEVRATWNLTDNTFSYQTLNTAPTITNQGIDNYPNGWKRIKISFNFATASSSAINLSFWHENAGQNNYYVWGVQLEAGSFPTSYIPTAGSTVTRSADVASITGTNFSSWHNSQGIGTIVSLAKGIKTAKLGAVYSIVSTDGSFSNMIEVEYDSRSSQLRIYKNSASIVDAGTINNDTFAKTCMSYSPGSYAAVLNGSIIATSNSAGDFPTPLSLLYLGRGYTDDGGRLNGAINRITYYPTRLQDLQLQQLTK